MPVNYVGNERLLGTNSPSLLNAPTEYNRRYQDDLNNLLRLYFITLDNFTANVIDVAGTRFFSAPYGSFENRATVTLASANTAYAIPFSDFTGGNDVSVVTDGSALTRITVSNAGIYVLQVCLQFANSSTTTLGDVSVWLAKNGTNVANTNSFATIPLQHGSSIPGYTSMFFSQTLSLQANDYLQLYTSANVATITLPYSAALASPTRPATCSAVGNLTYVSRL
jgi:hypothetical protein